MRLIPVVVLLLGAVVEGRYRCKGMDGKHVDWYVAYKLPTGIDNANGGKNFVYADSENPQWRLSRKPIDDEDSAIGATVSDAYRDDDSAFLFMYSDDGPTTKSDGYRGHAKGMLLFDGSTGFWLVHSVPNFPPIKHYSYPATGVKFAQSFLCVTVETELLPTIAEQLMFMQATPYKTHLPDSFASRYPTLRTIIGKKSLPSSATVFTSSKHIRTEKGTLFHAYHKHKKFRKDLWKDLVAADMRVSLGVESWLNGGADDLRSNCSGDYSVYDITLINMLGANFTSSKASNLCYSGSILKILIQDHSKWAVSDSQHRPVVCVGDLNRQKSQLNRGGGALCIENAALWRTYRATVVDVDPCAGQSKNTPFYLLLLIALWAFL